MLKNVNVGRGTAVEPRAEEAQRSGRPLVSICISAYNVERYFRQALESILAQTHRELEVVVVDNGSVDGTFDIAQSIDDERLQCFRLSENIGGYQAMNMVAGMAHGDFVAIYHSDDIYEPTIVEKEVAYLDSHPEAGAVFAMCNFIDERGVVFGGIDLLRELAGAESLRYEAVFRAMVRHGNVMFVCPSFMVRREVLLDVGPFDADRWDIASDQEMWLRLNRRYPVGILPERLVRYRSTPEQWTRRWKRLRVEPDRALDVLELYVEMDDWRARLTPSELLELRFKRIDDDTTRAANAVILGQTTAARELLATRYPYLALLADFRRRKLRVFVLRGLLKLGLACGAEKPLRRLLRATEYGEWHVRD
jgi:glycosyltransferase involved in cell wall biosynthesis